MSLGVHLGTNKPFEVVEGNFLKNLTDFYRFPEKYYLDPFRIAGNLYYVGDRKVCMHLIDTEEGLVLFDSGYQHTVHQLFYSIEKLGFSPKDVKMVIHSHGHFDHFGGGAAFRGLFGAELALSRADAERLKVNPRAALMEYSPLPYARIPEADRLLDDGDVITMGSTSIRCRLAPGHTEGTMAFFFNVRDEGKDLEAGYLGGIGFLPLYRAFLKKYDLPGDMQERMRATIGRMREEHPDITLGNHPNHNGTLEKRDYMLSHPGKNPFKDGTVWTEMLDQLEARLNDFQEKGY
ncbi:MAG: MBL fold metallo-hydrolase [Clostridia bacterium]|nr:MBL fold metallo-hydrolase [Clostridia bacterium]